MSDTNYDRSQTPLGILGEMEQRVLLDAGDGISESGEVDLQRLLSVQIVGVNFVLPVADVLHVTACEKLYPLPQTKKWLRGIVCEKGVVYSVTDLNLFAGHSKGVDLQHAHLLLLNRPVEQVALLIDQVAGFRHLADAQPVELDKDMESDLGEVVQYVDSSYQFDNETHYKLDLDGLMRSNRFLEVQ